MSHYKTHPRDMRFEDANPTLVDQVLEESATFINSPAGIAAFRTMLDVCVARRVAVLPGIEDLLAAQPILRQSAGGPRKSPPTETLSGAVLLIPAGGTSAPPLLPAAGSGEELRGQATHRKFGDSAREQLLVRGLAARDLDILELLMQGEPNKRIAEALCLSEGTVKVYITRILRNLNVRNRTQAAIAMTQLC